MKNILVIGSTGMIGTIVLNNCLIREDVSKVISIVRNKSNKSHPKLVEIIHKDFTDFSAIKNNFSAIDICFFCLGVYTGAVAKDEFNKITIDFTAAFSELLKQESPNAVFCFLSGQGADSSEKSSVLFAKSKGIAENNLLKLKFKRTHIFRPGYIYPVVKRKEPNVMYSIMRILYKTVFKWIYPNIGISSQQLAMAMLKVGFDGNEKTILENNDIRSLI